MTSFCGRLVKFALRLYTFRYRRKHMSLSRSVRPKQKPYRVPQDFNYSVKRYNEINVEILTPGKQNSDDIILQFHGGGNTTGMNNMYRKVAERYAYISGSSVYSIDYTTGNDKVHPQLLNECTAAYLGIIESGIKAENIIAVGDSMGANFMLAMCLKLKLEGQSLPKGLIVISPYIDLTASGDSYRKNCYRDPLYALPWYQSYKKYGHLVRRKSPYCGSSNPKDPFLSPAFGDYIGFPPMLIQCGDCETDESDSDMLHAAAIKGSVNVMLKKYKGMFHDFQYLVPFIKESKQAWKDIANFIESIR